LKHCLDLLFKTQNKVTRIAPLNTLWPCRRVLTDIEPGSTLKSGSTHMNAKFVISALVAALVLSACAKQEEVAAPVEAAAEAAAPAAEAVATAAEGAAAAVEGAATDAAAAVSSMASSAAAK
jgi:hypothetical protein